MDDSQEQPAQDKENAEPIEEALQAFAKKYTHSIFQRMNAATKVPLEVFPLGSLLVDAATQAGGGAYRSFNQLYGEDKMGKSTLAIACAAENSRRGKHVVYFGFEQKLLTDYFKVCLINSGGDPDFVTFIKPGSGREGLEMIWELTGLVPIIIIDSLAAIPATKTITLKGKEGIEHHYIGAHARLITDWVNAMRFKLGRTGVVGQDDVPITTGILVINQVREVIGGYGDGLKFTGGRAWRHALSLNIKISRPKQTPEDKKTKKTQGRCRALVVANTISAPWHEAIYKIVFDHGVELVEDTFFSGVAFGVIEKSGNSYSLDGEKLDLGKPRAMDVMRKWPRPELYALRERVHVAIVAGKEKEQNVEAAE